MSTQIATVSALKKQLQEISKPQEARKVADKAKSYEQAAKLVGKSLEQCNEYSEIYLEAVWVFGDLVKDIKPGRQSQTRIDTGLVPGTEDQRRYARKFRKAVGREGIRPYIEKCNQEQVQASISGCIACYDGGLDHNHRAQGTGKNEWYTPSEYVERARSAMGAIDLDPASSAKAQDSVQAGSFFDERDNGLEQEWHGRVWLNPPYSRELIGEFVAKLVAEYTSGNVTEAVLLTHNYSDTSWFHCAEGAASRVCFTRGRISFIDDNGEPCSPTQGQTFFYFGPNEKAFIEAFEGVGFIR